MQRRLVEAINELRLPCFNDERTAYVINYRGRRCNLPALTKRKKSRAKIPIKRSIDQEITDLDERDKLRKLQAVHDQPRAHYMKEV